MESLGVTIKVGVDRSLADEVYSLLGSIGFKKYTSYYPTKSSPWVYTNNNGNIMHCSFKADNDIEVDINQLRDLVVLKRKSAEDSNVKQKDDGCLYDLYLTQSNDLYFYHCGKEQWILSNLNGDDEYYKQLQPIEKKEMKQQEYLVKNADGKYFLTTSSNYPDGIKVPEDAQAARINLSKYLNFYKQVDGAWWLLNSLTNNEWHKPDLNNGSYNPFDGVFDLVWQRDNPEGLNSIGFDLGAEGGDETKITTIENPLFPDFELSEPVIESNDFNGLDKSEINHRVAKAFNVIRGTDLNEDDIHFLRELIDLTTSHYWDRK